MEDVDSCQTQDKSGRGFLHQVSHCLFVYSNLLLYRLVELDRQRITTLKSEREELDNNGGKDPDIDVRNPSMSLGGVVVKTIMVRIFLR